MSLVCKSKFTISMCPKDEKERKKYFFRFSPDFTHFSLNYSGWEKKTSLSNLAKIAYQFFSQTHIFFKTSGIFKIFFRECNLPYGLLPNQISSSHHIISTPQIKYTKKKTSLSSVNVTLKTLL